MDEEYSDCRTCTMQLKISNMESVFRSSKLAEMYRTVFAVSVVPDKRLPEFICLPCLTKLNIAYEFISKALKVQETYLSGARPKEDKDAVKKPENVLADDKSSNDSEPPTSLAPRPQLKLKPLSALMKPSTQKNSVQTNPLIKDMSYMYCAKCNTKFYSNANVFQQHTKLCGQSAKPNQLFVKFHSNGVEKHILINQNGAIPMPKASTGTVRLVAGSSPVSIPEQSSQQQTESTTAAPLQMCYSDPNSPSASTMQCPPIQSVRSPSPIATSAVFSSSPSSSTSHTTTSYTTPNTSSAAAPFLITPSVVAPSIPCPTAPQPSTLVWTPTPSATSRVPVSVVSPLRAPTVNTSISTVRPPSATLPSQAPPADMNDQALPQLTSLVQQSSSTSRASVIHPPIASPSDASSTSPPAPQDPPSPPLPDPQGPSSSPPPVIQDIHSLQLDEDEVEVLTEVHPTDEDEIEVLSEVLPTRQAMKRNADGNFVSNAVNVLALRSLWVNPDLSHCSLFEKRLKTESLLRSGMNLLCECSECRIVFLSETEYLDHFVYNDELKAFVHSAWACRACKANFNSKQLLEEHYLIGLHGNLREQYTCSLCPIFTNFNTCVMRHVLKIHSHCPHCYTNLQLARSVALQAGQGPLRTRNCLNCGLLTNRSSEVALMKVFEVPQREKRIICNCCCLAYGTTDELICHFAKEHPNIEVDGLLHCVVACGKNVCAATDLYKKREAGLLNNIKLEAEDEMEIVEIDSKVNWYCCSSCPAKFTVFFELVKHVTVRHSSPFYSCRCNRNFIDIIDSQKHDCTRNDGLQLKLIKLEDQLV